VGGPPFGPPVGPAQGGRGGTGEFFAFEGSPDHSSGGNREWTPDSELVHDNSRSPQRAEAPARSRVVGSLEDVLKAKESELSHLNLLLVQQAEEKRKIEHLRFQLAAENLNLRGQVAELQTRQRPWSASSAGSRPQLYQGQHQQQSNIHTIHEHKPQYLLQPQPGGAQRPPRPMSASQHQSAHPRDIPGQDLVRRHPVFGQESLLHRSTYAPTQSSAPIPDAMDSGPQKDFVRPEAFRMLNGVMQLEGSARPASRMRPQSANAAVRQVTLRPASGASRPGSARPRSSYAERLMHADADEIARFHVRLPTEDVTQRVINILAFMRSAAEKKFIRVGDFMVSFDKLKRGHISCTEFRRALESCGCFGDLSEEEYNLVFSFFLHESSATADVLSPMSRISYTAFCEVLQPVGDKRVKLNVDQHVLKEIGQKKGQAAQDSALCTNELSAEGETKLKTLVERILAAIKTNRISARDFLERLDPRSAHGKGSRVSPNVNVSTGSISRSQYLRVSQCLHLMRVLKCTLSFPASRSPVSRYCYRAACVAVLGRQTVQIQMKKFTMCARSRPCVGIFEELCALNVCVFVYLYPSSLQTALTIPVASFFQLDLPSPTHCTCRVSGIAT